MENVNIAYIEVRGGTGGDEAKIWASDLLRMYMHYANKKKWRVKQLDEGTLKISGEKVYKLLRNESGVHRVQRIPATEKRGRIHTSTATVAVLPQITHNKVKIDEKDLDWQFFKSGGAGGQNVNKVNTAVRVIHKPSGLTVTSQSERHQEQNRQIALEILRSKLWNARQEEKEKRIAGLRSAIGRGMRAEKIRTYNYPQNRVTDHRINKKWGNLEAIVDGNLEKVIKLSSKIS